MKVYAYTLIALLLISCKADVSPERGPSEDKEVSMEEAYLRDYKTSRIKWGYLSTDGEVALSGKWDDCNDFSEGLAAVNVQGKWGYIRTDGSYLYEPQYRAAWSMQDGMARVLQMDGNYAIVDAAGGVIVQLGTDMPAHPSDDMIRMTHDGTTYYVDMQGNRQVQANYSTGTDFQEGAAIVSRQSIYGLIDKQGEEILPITYDRIRYAGSGYYRLYKNKAEQLYHHPSGKMSTIGAQRFSNVQDGQIAARTDGVWELYTLAGDKVASWPEALDARAAGAGRWHVQFPRGVRLADSSGKYLSDQLYTMINPYSEGLAGAAVGEDWGYVDLDGQWRVRPQYPILWDYSEGLARAIGPQGIQYIDPRGAVRFRTQYFEARDFHDGLARVELRKFF